MTAEYQFVYGEQPDTATKHRDILSILWEHQCEVTFTKINGEERVMTCTLMKDAMPQRESNTLHETRIHNPSTISVWCLDNSEWRAMKTDNIKHIRVLDGK